jgi:hypothetical protein
LAMAGAVTGLMGGGCATGSGCRSGDDHCDVLEGVFVTAVAVGTVAALLLGGDDYGCATHTQSCAAASPKTDYELGPGWRCGR